MSVFLEDAAATLARGGRVVGLPEGAAAWTVARAVSGPAWVVLPTPDEAERFARALAFWLCDGGPVTSERAAATNHRTRVLAWPAHDLPPYSGVSPHPGHVRDRIVALDALRRQERVLVVASAESLLERVPVPGVLGPAVLEVSPGRVLHRAAFLATLARFGYLSAALVEDPGTWAVRGGIVDLWPTGEPTPVRIDLFDEEVETIRRFDPATQRSGVVLAALRVLPARLWLPDPEAVERLAEATRRTAGTNRDAVTLRRRVIETLGSRLAFAGVEDWIAGLHPVASPLDHAPSAILAVEPDRMADPVGELAQRATTRWSDLGPDERPLVPPEDRFDPPDGLLARLREAPRLETLPVEDPDRPAQVPDVRGTADLAVTGGDLAPFVDRIGRWLEDGWRVALTAPGRADAERLLALLAPHGIRAEEVSHRDPDRLRPGRVSLFTGDLPSGFRAPEDRLVVVPLSDLLAERRSTPGARRHHAFHRAQAVGVGTLKEGDLVVHAFHGIGRFQGMARIPLGGVETDLVQLQYRDGDRLYVPVHKIGLLSRYRAASDAPAPRLDRLGGQTWQARKRRVKDAMLVTAHDLLALYARRSVATCEPLPPPGDLSRRFSATFSYDETPDQVTAIEDVDRDLSGTSPMDRLVVGDVGFGKTEVAMRGAARMVEAGRQVAMLCPTTVLAYQHHQTFTERFRGFPVKIAMLSRFSTPLEARATLAGLASGEVQIVVGTTRLLGRAVRFRDLGLVVIDEEHRFGVRQKERLKKIRTEVHVLALSATPIPRSLSMALTGVRAFSTIATPPEDRLAIRTRIARFHPDLVREEILREMARGGQVFLVHDRIRSLPALKRLLERIVPEARVETTHGSMPDDELEAALVRFVRRQADVLLTTTIIESGMDLPNVNCMLVNRADRFGLAQLYQLRGRVGRSWRRATCILMVPADAALSRKATRRLRVLLEHTDLGAGFQVASADLEHRGAGEILGENQHGHVDAVGFDTYVDLLEEALSEARGEARRRRLDPEVEVPVPAFLPESMVAGVEERLGWYGRLAAADTPDEVRSLLDALEEQTGDLPQEAVHLGWLLQTRLGCRDLGIARLTWLKVRVEVVLDEESPIRRDRLVSLAGRWPNRFTVTSEGHLHVRFTPQEAEVPFRFLHWLLRLVEEEAVDRPTNPPTPSPRRRSRRGGGG